MTEQNSIILDNEQIQKKLNRIAYQIAENNYDEQEVYLIGIKENGFVLAKQLQKLINKIVEVKTIVASLTINKKKPHLESIEISLNAKELNNKVVIIIDDVASTGSTLTYALKPFLEIRPKKIQTAVLVDRKHKSFPVCVDYVGLSLATTMKEHIDVDMTAKQEKAFLI